MLYSRYASPLDLLDTALAAGLFSAVIQTAQKQIEETKLWDYFLHCVRGQSFADFKNGLKSEKTGTFADAVNTAYRIILNFNPEGGDDDGTI